MFRPRETVGDRSDLGPNRTYRRSAPEANVPLLSPYTGAARRVGAPPDGHIRRIRRLRVAAEAHRRRGASVFRLPRT